MAADPNDFAYFDAGELVPYQQGETSTGGFDYWRAGEVFPGVVTVTAAPAAGVVHRQLLLGVGI
jgi:hypothetical protein